MTERLVLQPGELGCMSTPHNGAGDITSAVWAERLARIRHNLLFRESRTGQKYLFDEEVDVVMALLRGRGM